MRDTLHWAQKQALEWVEAYGYGAVVPALLADPGGVPWPWVFLMLLAEEAGKSVVLMLFLGCAAMTLCDHVLYWVGVCGGRPLLRRIARRWPRLAVSMESAEEAVRERGLCAVALGRFLPLVGRYVGLGAGLAGVPYVRFALFDVVGVGLSVVGFGLLAHFVGRKTVDAPWFPEAVGGMFLLGTALTVGALAWQVWKSHSESSKEKPAQKDVETAAFRSALHFSGEKEQPRASRQHPYMIFTHAP